MPETNNSNWTKIPTDQGQTSWQFTSMAEDLNTGLPRTNPANDQSGTWTRGLQIASPALQPHGDAASNSILITGHYPDLSSASDWSCRVISMECLRSLLRLHVAGKPVVASPNVRLFSNRPFALRGQVTSFLWKWKLYNFAFEKRLVGHILNKIIVIWFFKPAPFS